MKKRWPIFAVIFFLLAFAATQARASQTYAPLPTTGTLTGLQAVTDMNQNFDALITALSGTTSTTPLSPALGWPWLDTGNKQYKFYDGTQYIVLYGYDGTAHTITVPFANLANIPAVAPCGDSTHALAATSTGFACQTLTGGGGGTSLSALTSATTTSSIDNTNKAISWAWGTLSTESALTFTTSSMTTGNLLTLSNTKVSSTGNLLSLSNTTTNAGKNISSVISGAANTGYAGYFSNTGTGAVNYALYATASSTTGYAGYFVGNVNVTGNLTGAAAALTGTLTGTTANFSGNVTLGGSGNSVGTITSGTWNGSVIGSSFLAVSTSTAFGAMKPDNSTITISGGVISAPGSGGGTVNSGVANAVGFYSAGGTAISGTTTANASINAGAMTLGSTGVAGSLKFGNATSGTITVQPVTGALGSVTVSLPAATDTLVGKATTDTLTNKTFDTAGTGNSFSINGVAATANSGTGAVVRVTSPALTTPNLGTPSALVLTNASGLPTSALPANQVIRGITYVIDGGGSTITTGIKGAMQVPFACTVTSNTLLADQSGSIVVNVWKTAYSGYPGNSTNKITSSAPPTISSAQKSTDSTLTGWTTSISAGDTLMFNVDSVTTITRVTIILACNAT